MKTALIQRASIAYLICSANILLAIIVGCSERF